jgi:hypothetical protein
LVFSNEEESFDHVTPKSNQLILDPKWPSISSFFLELCNFSASTNFIAYFQPAFAISSQDQDLIFFTRLQLAFLKEIESQLKL